MANSDGNYGKQNSRLPSPLGQSRAVYFCLQGMWGVCVEPGMILDFGLGVSSVSAFARTIAAFVQAIATSDRSFTALILTIVTSALFLCNAELEFGMPNIPGII